MTGTLMTLNEGSLIHTAVPISGDVREYLHQVLTALSYYTGQ